MQIAPIATLPVATPAHGEAPTQPATPPQRAPLPALFFDSLRAVRAAAADAITGVRALDRTAPLTETEAVQQVLASTKLVLASLRTAATIEGLPKKMVVNASGPINALNQASLLLSGTAKMGGPARTDLVLDRLDTELSAAWVTASRILTKLGQPLEVAPAPAPAA